MGATALAYVPYLYDYSAQLTQHHHRVVGSVSECSAVVAHGIVVIGYCCARWLLLVVQLPGSEGLPRQSRTTQL